MGWGKDVGRELIPLVDESKRSMTSVGDEESFERSKKFTFSIHTHPPNFPIKKRGGAIPSKTDVFSFLKRVEASPGKRKIDIIVSVNRSGEVLGYTFLEIKKGKEVQEVRKELAKRLSSRPFIIYTFHKGGSGFVVPPLTKNRRLIKAYFDALNESGIKLKHIAMPG